MTELRLLILGLLAREPRSAYALGHALSAMPAASYSGSPGAIYPAVQAMHRDGLLQRGVSPDGDTRGQPYTLTEEGRKVLAEWLGGPIEGWDLVRSPGTVLLRLSFARSEATRRKLKRALGQAAAETLADLLEYHDAAEPDLAASSSETLELTAALFRAYVAWAGHEG